MAYVTHDTAIDVIREILASRSDRAEVLDALLRRAEADEAYAVGKVGRALQAVTASAKAARRAIGYLEAKNAEAFEVDMGAGIIALHCAAQELGLSRAAQTALAVRTWGDK